MMSRKRVHKTPVRPAPQTKPPGSSRQRWLLIVVLGAIVAAIGTRFLLRSPVAEPPVIATAGFEAVVASQIEQALATVRSHPRSGVAWGTLGMIFQAHELSGEARFCYEQAERFDATESRWPYLAGLLLYEEHTDAALAKFVRAASLDGTNPDAARLRLAQIQFQLGHLEAAENHFKTLLQSNPNHAPARIGLAELNHVQGRDERAREFLGPCLTNVHTAKRAHVLLGQVEQRLGRPEAAEKAIRNSAMLPPDVPWPDPFLAEVARHRVGFKGLSEQTKQLLDQSRHAEAQPLLDRLVKEYPAAAEGWLLLGRSRLERNDCAGAESCFRKVLQLATDSVNGHAQLGVALLCQERYADAIPIFQRAIRLKPDFGEAHFNLGFALGRAGRASEAIEPFRNAIRHSPNFADPYVTLADLLSQKGETEEAVGLLRRALQLKPADERAKFLLQRIER